jgi:predicted P-loop ATPase
VLDYLQYLEKADDVEPVDINKIATNYLNTESNLSDQMMKVALLGAVARRFEPGCQFDTVVVLKGDQGIRKSTFWKILCSPLWFCDSTPKDNKEMIMNMHSCWIFELAELENITSKKGVGEIKALITTASDMIKKPYGRNIERDNRRSIMVSSVNGDDFLRDPSGNRRFQVISLPQKAQKQEFIPVELVGRDRDRIWKAAILAYRAGEKPMLSLENQELSNQQNKGYLPEDMWSSKLDRWLSGVNEYGPDLTEPRTFFTTLDALEGVGFTAFKEKLGRREEMRMAALLQTKGFLKDDQQKTINGVRGYYWHQSE